MKYYEIIYYNAKGEKLSVIVKARTAPSAFMIACREYGAHTVASVDEVINKMSAKDIRYMRDCYTAFIKQKHLSLYECYKKPSQVKRNAYDRCLMHEIYNCGYSGTIISHNSQSFVYAYETETHFIVIAPTRKLTILKEELI